MKVKMPTGRVVTNLLADTLPERNVIMAADGQEVAIAAVDNSSDGICPKCRSTMGTAIIPQSQVYYCTSCRVTTPIAEEG